MDNELILGIIGAISAIATVFIKQQHNHSVTTKNQKSLETLITDKDLAQDARIVKLTKSMENVIKYIEHQKYKNRLLLKIRGLSTDIKNLSSINNPVMLNMVDNIGISYNTIIERILNTELSELSISDIENDILVLSRNINNSTDFTLLGIDNIEELKKKWKIEVVQSNMRTFLSRLNGEILKENNKYNGTFERIATDTIGYILKDTIKFYNQMRK